MSKNQNSPGPAVVSEQDVRQALTGVLDPELRRSIVDLGMVRDARCVRRHSLIRH